MNQILDFLVAIVGMAVLAGGFMGVQLLARKMGIRNHIDHGGCCGACSDRDSCTRRQA
jgi:hypothetical protein